MRRFRLASLAAGLLLGFPLALPPGIAAATTPLTITADRAAAVPSGHLWAYNDFFPRVLSIHSGTTIRFAIQGFHTATLVPAAMSATTARRTMGLATSDTDDTTPNANGSSHIEIRLPSTFPMPGGCGSSAHPCTFDGSAPVSTGAPLAGPIPTMNVKVTAPAGFYRFLCLIHPNMQGWLAVVPSGFHTTTASEFNAAVRSQIASDRSKGFAAEARASVPHSRLNADGSRTWIETAGTGSADGYVAVLEMLPKRLPIKRGDSVLFISRGLNEPHTVTFPTDLHTDMLALCENGATDTPATPTVIPPTGPGDFSCNGGPPDEIEFDGGNGVTHVTSPSTVADSGLIASAGEKAGFGLPASAARSEWTASFAGAQRTTYHFVCQIHDGMAGTIVVS